MKFLKAFLLLTMGCAWLAHGAEYFVDPGKGEDGNAGTQQAPWKTVQHGVTQLRAGDVLTLREGVYFENIYLAMAGTADQPITIQAYTGEEAVIDGGWREFQEEPETAWEPVVDSKIGEYQSTRTYPNVREVLGSLGQSLDGLQTYYYAKDLRAENELLDWEDWENRDQSDLKPLYCGPGLWYARDTGRIHLRLSHTHLPDPIRNYERETDPRKTPLVLAPFDSVPLKLDGARHVRLRDLTIRGAGYTSIVFDQAKDVEMENVTVWCGTYGVMASGTQQLRLFNCGFYGNVAPWTFRADCQQAGLSGAAAPQSIPTQYTRDPGDRKRGRIIRLCHAPK